MYNKSLKLKYLFVVIISLTLNNKLLMAQAATMDSVPVNNNSIHKDTVSKKRKLPLIPFIFYAPETSVGFTLNYAKNFKNGISDANRTSSIILTGLYTLENQWAIRGTYKGYYPNSKLVTFNDFTFGEDNGYYYGIGAEAADGEGEYYKNLEFRFEHKLLKQIKESPYYLGYGFRIQYVDFYKTIDNVLINDLVIGPNGANGGWNNGFGVGFMMDTRDNNLFPTKGMLMQSQYVYYSKLVGSDFQYGKFKFSSSWYAKLSAKAVLATNARFEHNGDDVPFFAMTGTNVDEKLRGYYRGRPRDRNMGMMQVEYRRKLGKKERLRMALFTGSSWVASENDGKFKVSNAFPMVGAGLRIPLTKDGYMLRLDFAIGRYDPSFYVGGGEAF